MLKRKSAQKKKNENQYNWFLYGALLSLLLVLAGCGGTHVHHRYDEFRTAQQAELEARLVDVPLPIGTHIQQTDIIDGSYMLRACIKLSRSDIITHFVSELERCGWSCAASCHGNVLSTYIFEKPHKVCVIHVETAQERSATSSLVLSYIMKS